MKKRGRVGSEEEGSTSVELTIGFVTIAAMLTLVLAVSSLGIACQGLCRGAGEAARMAVSGAADVEVAGRQALGSLVARGAQVSVIRSGQRAFASVSMPGSSIASMPLPPPIYEVHAKLGSLVPRGA